MAFTGKLAKVVAVTTAIGAISLAGVAYTSKQGDIQGFIDGLKQKALAWQSQSNKNKQAYDNLKAQYDNIIELLGLKPEHYFYINDVGQLLIDNKSLFLSSRVATTFAGYIISQTKFLHTVYTRNTTKQMMHMARLYIMGEEILSTGKINTFREKEHNLLMSIRNGDFIDKEKEIPTQEFWTLINTLQENFYYAEKHTILTQHIDTEKIYDLLESINEKIVKNN